MVRRYRNKRYKQNQEIDPVAAIIFLVVVLIGGFYYFIVRPTIEFVKSHWISFVFLGIFIIGAIVIYFVLYIRKTIKNKKEKRAFEKEQIEKGLIKFIDRFGNERWGKPDEVQKWTKSDELAKEKESLMNRIIDEINLFVPSKKYNYEFPYQIELVGFLKSKFPNAKIEQQRGSSRPDIVIGDVAIEIKGPTRHRELDTIMNKCARYEQHFGEIVMVLFEVEVVDRYYNEWEKGIKNKFPNVRIVRK